MKIEHLRSRFRSKVPLDPRCCEAWVQTLRDQDGDALGAGLTGADDWLLIRHLPLALRWRADAAEVDVARQWTLALQRALRQAAGHLDDANVLRYPNRRAAVADLLYRSALGERQRQWAWHRMGLTARGEATPAETLHDGIALLLREPELVWPTLRRLVQAEPATAAFTAVLRALPAAAWQRLLAVCPQTAGYQRGLAEPPVAPAVAGEAVARPASGAAQSLLGWAAGRPHLTARHADTLAVLVAALAWPAQATAAVALGARLAAVQRWLADIASPPPPTTTRMTADRGPDGRATPAPQPHADPAARAVPGHQPADAPPLPALPAQEDWRPTAWAGALFWLARVPASGLLDTLPRRRDVPPHALPLLLRAIVQALGVPQDDAATAAFCGGDAPADAVPAVLVDLAATLVSQWALWLDQAGPDLPPPRLTAVCNRSGRLRLEPGWIDVQLPLDQVDVTVRRLGLDLDPGWLPWLGCSMRICYGD